MSSSITNNGNIDHDYSITSYSNEEEDPYSSFYNFPSPYVHYEDSEILLQHLHDLFSQQQITQNTATTPPQEDHQVLTDNSTAPPAPTRKRTGKSDRHSKIQTAQGTRDRRMRLSIQVARPFFDLQDRLGFDKASKTIDWLLKGSKTAIKELYSGNTENADDDDDNEFVPAGNIETSESAEMRKSKSAPKEKKNRAPSHKFAFDPNAKETREKARARARERTTEKRKLHESRLHEIYGENPNQLGFSTSPQGCACSSFLDVPFPQQLHISDYGKTWQDCDNVDPF